MIERLNLLGAVAALVIYVSNILTFAGRMVFDLPPGHWIGVPFLLVTFPLVFLLYQAPSVGRRLLYYIQVGLMLASIIVLFFLDYIFALDWRATQLVVVSFVVLYFAGLGGMIGVASLAGKRWTIMAVALFFVTAAMAFLQRAVTGL